MGVDWPRAAQPPVRGDPRLETLPPVRLQASRGGGEAAARHTLLSGSGFMGAACCVVSSSTLIYWSVTHTRARTHGDTGGRPQGQVKTHSPGCRLSGSGITAQSAGSRAQSLSSSGPAVGPVLVRMRGPWLGLVREATDPGFSHTSPTPSPSLHLSLKANKIFFLSVT